MFFYSYLVKIQSIYAIQIGEIIYILENESLKNEFESSKVELISVYIR